MTLERFARWSPPDSSRDSHWELHQGRLARRRLGTPLHGLVCCNATILLQRYADSTGFGCVLCNGVGTIVSRNPDTVLGPDVIYCDLADFSDDAFDEWLDCPPLVVVEVLAPDDTVGSMDWQVDEYLAFGVQQVWVVDPDTKDVAVHRAGHAMRLLEGDDELSGGDDLPGFSCRVSDFFRLPGQKVT